jgi:hypothetical protein
MATLASALAASVAAVEGAAWLACAEAAAAVLGDGDEPPPQAVTRIDAATSSAARSNRDDCMRIITSVGEAPMPRGPAA